MRLFGGERVSTIMDS
ncbi:hypothetical protein [Ruthenibacterium lactatiformans]